MKLFFHQTQSEHGLRVKNKVCNKLGTDEKGGYVTRLGPGDRIFFATQPELAKFLMTIKPEFVGKVGLTDMLFGDDPNGFYGGLVCEERLNLLESKTIFNYKSSKISSFTVENSVKGRSKMGS